MNPLQLLYLIADAPTLDGRLGAAQTALDTAAALFAEASRVRAQAMSEARAEGWSLERVSQATGLSKGRVAQVLSCSAHLEATAAAEAASHSV